MKSKENSGITLIALVITIIVLLILAGVTIQALTGDNGILDKAKNASEEMKISTYKEKIEMKKAELMTQNEDFTVPSIYQIKSALEKEKWINNLEIITDNQIDKLKITTKEGYIFYVTGDKTEYKGKGEIVDTEELEKSDVIGFEIIGETENGKTVKITDLSQKEYYKIKYQINGGQWQEVKSGETVEVPYGGELCAKLFYGSSSGEEHKMSIQNTSPTIVAKDTNTNNLVRKTNLSIASLFDIKWGSDGIGTTQYSITGTLKFKGIPFSSTINSLSEIELGKYTLTCKITSPSGAEASAQKNIEVTTLAEEIVVNNVGKEVGAYAIYSSYDLAEFRDMVNNGSSSINAKQKENIDLNIGKWSTDENGITTFSNNAIQWTPIGRADYNVSTNTCTNEKPFNGIYDGDNKEINGLYINDESLYWVGLFGSSGSSTMIKNVIVKNSSVANYIGAGGICGTGGIVGGMKIINCKNYANIKSSFCAGGMIGAGEKVYISNCENYGKIEQSKKLEKDASGYGGIAGYATGNIANCKNSGSVLANLQIERKEYFGVAGIVGNTKTCEITNCSNGGFVSSQGGTVGGIVGYANAKTQEDRVLISGCFNTGEISTVKSIAGGIAGWSSIMSIENCYNIGSVSGKDVGGIIQYIRNRRYN